MCELKFYFPGLKKSLMIDSEKCQMFKTKNGKYYALAKIKKNDKILKSSRFLKKSDYEKFKAKGCDCKGKPQDKQEEDN